MTLVKGTIYNEASFFGKNFCSSEVTTKDFCALLSMSYKNLAHKIILMPGDYSVSFSQSTKCVFPPLQPRLMSEVLKVSGCSST